MDTKAQMRRNYLAMRRAQNIEQEEITIQKKIQEQYEKAKINHATLQYEKKLEKYRMHQLASQMKNLENNPSDTKKRTKKKAPKMTALMAIEAEKEKQHSQCETDQVETMIERDTKTTSASKMGFLFENHDIDDLVDNFCSKLKSKKKEPMHQILYPDASYKRKKASLDEFISQHATENIEPGKGSARNGVSEIPKEAPLKKLSSRTIKRENDVLSKIDERITSIDKVVSDNNTNICENGAHENTQEHKGVEDMSPAKTITQRTDKATRSFHKLDRNESRSRTMRVQSAKAIESSENATNDLVKRSKSSLSDVALTRSHSAITSGNPRISPKSNEGHQVTLINDSGISSGSSYTTNLASQQRRNSDLPQNKDANPSDISNSQVPERGISLKDIVAKKHRKKVPDGVKVKHCWVGDPEAINSIRRPIMSPHEKLLKQLVQRAMERKQEQAAKSSCQAPADATFTTDDDGSKVSTKKQKQKKKFKRSESDIPKEVSSNPYPVMIGLNRPQTSQTSRVHTEDTPDRLNPVNDKLGKTKRRPVSAPVSKQDHDPTTTGNVIALTDNFKLDVSKAVFKKDSTGRKTSIKPKHLTSASYTPSSSIWTTPEETQIESQCEPLSESKQTSGSLSTNENISSNPVPRDIDGKRSSAKERSLSRPSSTKRSVQRSLTQPTFSSLQKLSKDSGNAPPPSSETVSNVKRSNTTAAVVRPKRKSRSGTETHISRHRGTDGGVIRIPCAIDEEEVSLV